MKTKFDNRQCAHVWSQLSQPFGESASMHFDGAVLYSYRTPIARIYHVTNAPSGVRVVLCASESYSVTTSGKHMPAMHRALRDDDITFSVPHVLTDTPAGYDGTRDSCGRASIGTHADNLAYLAKQFQLEYNRLRRARVADYAALHTLKAKARQYAEIFGLPDPGCDSVEAERSIRLERIVKLERSNTPAKIAARARADAKKAARDAKIAAAGADKLAQWRAGADIQSPTWDRVNATGELGTALRIKGNEVQTSRGASVPVADARRVIPLIRMFAKALAKEAATRGAKLTLPITRIDQAALKVGHFQVDEITSEGIHAGCHFITHAEINRIALELGL